MTTTTATHTTDAYDIIENLEALFLDNSLDITPTSMTGMVLGLLSEQVYIHADATADVLRYGHRLQREAADAINTIGRNLRVQGLVNTARTAADFACAGEVREKASQSIVVMIARVAAATHKPESFRKAAAAVVFGEPQF